MPAPRTSEPPPTEPPPYTEGDGPQGHPLTVDSLTRLDLQEGDVLWVKMPSEPTAEVAERAKQLLDQLGIRAVVSGPDVELEVVRGHAGAPT